MNHSEQIRETYALFGVAVYYAQVLEHGIINALMILRFFDGSGFSGDDVDQFMDRQFKEMLGKMTRNLRGKVSIPPDLEDYWRKR